MKNAVSAGFARYADFKGRSTRSEYWYWYLFTIIAISLSGILDNYISKGNSYLSSILEMVIFLPTIAVGIRRLHDSGRRGWWLLLPIVNIIFLIAPSGEDNQYGTRPYRSSN
jgi:uncharacterized membrane protein YhaH (DUF805 family)